MDELERQLNQLAERRAPAIRPLDVLERQAKARRRRVIGVQTVVFGLALVAVALPALRAWEDASPVRDRPGVAAGGAPTPTASPSELGECTAANPCDSRGERLREAESWLGSTLDAAGLAYRSNYRPDGGGGHFVPSGQFLVSALRPSEGQPAQEAAKYEHRPVVTHGDAIVYGSTDSDIWYFYWRAGGVDMFAETVWPPSRRESLPRLESLFGRIIDAANANPYPDGGA